MQSKEKGTTYRIRWEAGEHPYETMLIWDIKEEELKPDHRQIDKWSILSDVVKYAQWNQYPTRHYELEAPAPEDSVILRCIKS